MIPRRAAWTQHSRAIPARRAAGVTIAAVRSVIVSTTVGLCLVLCVVAGCAAGSPPELGQPEVRPYLGVYQGSFDSALTEDPGDDLNFNPCTPGDGQDCTSHQQPLSNVLLVLEAAPNGTVSPRFYRDRSAMEAGTPLDLLGSGCGTRLGTLGSVQQTPEGGWSADVPLTAANRLCLGKLRPVSRHTLHLAMSGANRGSRQVRVTADKAVRDTNYLYVVEDGVKRRVKIDLDNTVQENHQTRYRVCIENDLGEYDRCVLTDREFKSFVLPVPVPGGVAVNYTWWQELSPKLRRTRGRYEVEQYVGHFAPAPAGAGRP